MKKQKIQSFGKVFLKLSICFNAIAIVLEPLTWMLDGEVFFGSFFLEYSTNFLLCLMAPILGATMLSYVDYHIFKDRNRLQKRWYYSHFAIITFGLLVINIFYPLYFSVNPETVVFSNGNFRWIHYILVGIMYLYMTAFVFKHKEKTSKRVITVFLIFFLLPILGMFVQIIEVRLNFAWASIALAILVIYVFLESTSGEMDYLTRIYSRLSYEKHVKNLMEQQMPFEIVLMDLDKFKKVNDKFGHLEGDRVLIRFAQILQKTFYPNPLVARLAGDEFIVVIENGESCKHYVKNIYKELQSDNNLNVQNISFSCGCQKWSSDNDLSIDEIYTKVDNDMYQNKDSKETN